MDGIFDLMFDRFSLLPLMLVTAISIQRSSSQELVLRLSEPGKTKHLSLQAPTLGLPVRFLGSLLLLLFFLGGGGLSTPKGLE